MKFARYLEETQTTEWQKAYIDYRGLKKRITAIRRAQEQQQQQQQTSSDTNLSSVQPGDSDPSISSSEPRPQSVRPLPRLLSSISAHRGTLRSRKFSRLGDQDPTTMKLPLHELLPHLSPVEVAFFDALDVELEKIETFYLQREQEMKLRGETLSEQLKQLSDHRKAYYAAFPVDKSRWLSALKRTNIRLPKLGSADSSSDDTAEHTPAPSSSHGRDTQTSQVLSPDEYRHAKKTLKKAIQEYYRGLEVLHNYRILNYTGFRKTLKKFEKVTRILAQDAYISEKVDTSGIANGAAVKAMIDDTEILFAARFAEGNKKKAIKRLRGGNRSESHHFSSFRSGTYIGLSLPALAYGLYESFQPISRQEIVAWPALLRIYGVLFVPVFFALLVGINLLIFTRARINYIFIFELDLRTRLDYRQYFEIPAMLLATLCYAFWLSFARIGSSTISPHIWPCIWLAVSASIMINPFPVLHKSSRYWLIRNSVKLLLSGTRRVEFSSFWLGDQFCSLVYTFSNLYFIGCVYSSGFGQNWAKCGASSPHWAAALVLGILPFIVRLVQSIKRYADSGLATHLINGGKYASGILANALYLLWRHRGSPRGSLFVVWVVFNIIYSSYALLWDYLMDWSFMRPHAKYPFLRPELVYSSYIPMYYLAIISNAVLRFTWLLYIPHSGLSTDVRAFIFACLEAIRRFNWNTYRLENEHLGNVDQYRVTREVPLPYMTEESNRRGNGSEDDDEDGVEKIRKKTSRRVLNGSL